MNILFNWYLIIIETDKIIYEFDSIKSNKLFFLSKFLQCIVGEVSAYQRNAKDGWIVKIFGSNESIHQSGNMVRLYLNILCGDLC
jgi:hypothetical protein